MTVTISLDYDQVTFTSTVLDVDLLETLGIKYKKNCGTISDTIDITDKIADIVDGTLTLGVSDIITSAEVFPDGVYYFELLGTTFDSIPPPDNGSHTLTACVYIGTTSRCKALKKYNETENEIFRFVINALNHVNDCDDCNCSTMCDVYDYLTTLLDTNTTSTDVSSTCGCN